MCSCGSADYCSTTTCCGSVSCYSTLVPAKNVMLAAKRLGVTQDVEIEMDRFETARDATLAKYWMMQRPKGKLADAVNLAVDGVAILCLGLSDGEAVKAEDEVMLTADRHIELCVPRGEQGRCIGQYTRQTAASFSIQLIAGRYICINHPSAIAETYQDCRPVKLQQRV